jgi:NADH-quinone oxidoreductase subunit I
MMIRPLLKGLALTLKYFFSPSVTTQYPEERREPYPRYRGRHLLLVHEDGRIKCIACHRCEKVCPSQCITVEGARDEQKKPYPLGYVIDLSRCIFCGFCVEVCPVDALGMTTHYEMAEFSRPELIMDKETLLRAPIKTAAATETHEARSDRDPG